MRLNVNHLPTMHALSRKFLFLAISAATVFSTGCRKKPLRPDPSSTVMSQPGTIGALDASGFGTGFDSSFNAGSTSGLTESGSTLLPQGAYQDGDKIYGLLQPVYFAFDQSAISGPERVKLDAAKTYLADNPTQRLLIEGRADWRGTNDYNLGLGDRRAAAAKQYLVTLGVADSRIEILSKGDLEAVENGSDDVMAKDRRADLVVLKK